MADEHVSREAMERFLRAELSGKDTKEIVRHLLARCPDCLTIAREVSEAEGFSYQDGEFEPAWLGTEPDRYSEVFLKLLGSGGEAEERLAREKLRAIGLWSELKGLRQEVRLAKLRSEARFQTWGLYERLLEACREAGFRDPAAAVDVAHLALAVVESLDPAEYGAGRVADFRATALGALGNAKRLAADFEGAETAFGEARSALEGGTGDLLEQARLLSLEASLRKDLGEFERAVQLLDDAILLYKGLNDTHLWGRSRLQQADAIGYTDAERGLELAQEGLALIDPQREPLLELCGRHTLAMCLVATGRPREALAMVEISRPLYAQFGTTTIRLRLHWLEGGIARSLGDLAEAEATFARLWREMRERELFQEAALVALELAEVQVARGKAAEARRLVREVHPLLKQWGLHAEGLAVWLLLRQALARETFRTEAFARTAEYLRRAWHRPLEERG
jgi:tetratricopeptide (TPR) repeat protein